MSAGKKDLQELLKICTSLTNPEDNSKESITSVDPERMAFLSNVLKEMNVDVVSEFKNHLEALNDPSLYDPDNPPPKEVLDSALRSLDAIGDWVGNMDLAIGFQKIGGFSSVLRILQSPHSSLVSSAGSLIGELCQNNPVCQEAMLKEGFLKKLMELSFSSLNVNARTGCLFGLSSLLRGYEPAVEVWMKENGPAKLLEALKSPDYCASVRLRMKTCFLVGSLCEEFPERVVPAFSGPKAMAEFVKIVDKDLDKGVREQISKALSIIVPKTSDKSLFKDELKSICYRRAQELKNCCESQEEYQYYSIILKNLK